jgi:hypothetical protein
MFLGSKLWPVSGADNLTAIYECLDIVGSLTSHNPIGLHGLSPFQGMVEQIKVP